MRAMNDCRHATAVLEAVVAGEWPERVNEELRSHVSACPSCAELLDLSRALSAEAGRLASEASLPTAGAMWWRMQARQRAESARVAERPIAVVQLLALASGIGAAVASVLVLIVWLGRPVHPGPAPLAMPLSASLATALERSVALVQSSLPIAMAVVLSAILVPLVLYFAMVED